MTNVAPALAGGRSLAKFRGVNAWIFDLDNTLYPRSTNLFQQVDRRIHDFVANLLNLTREDAKRVQKDYYQRYGTTLRGLMQEHRIDPDEFLVYVHDIDHSVVEPDPRLAAAIEKLPGRKFILTNGSRAHAEKTAERLGVTRHFEDIFDIVSSDLLPKPAAATYDKFLATTGVTPAHAAMFEDLSRNLAVPAALGMATVLIIPTEATEILGEAWEQEGRDAPHVDFVTDNLSAFLEGVLAEIAAK
jgi:putative hydrolase of the HAD superfamily